MINQFQNPIVRDLAWAIGSESLLHKDNVLSTQWFQQQFQLTLDWFHQLDQDPTKLVDFISSRKTYRLGIYFENLIAFWLENHPTFRLLAHDLQVYEGKQTKGAFDFLVEDEQGVHHWEVCVKFYLSIDGSADWMQWIGPHQKDRLGLKLNKTFHRQLHLCETLAGKQALQQHNIAFPITTKMWIKGILFAHWQGSKAPPLHGFPPQGIWMYEDELPLYLRSQPHHVRWSIRKKPDWLSSVINSHSPVLNANELRDLQLERTTMFSQINDSANRLEAVRLFICPNAHRSQKNK